ncbi:MAG: rRNA adenine methyltransferase [Ardenticatenaceae bacterium]|nr:rRNA adenine methyltransferase [Ardenticatenaceae bacterium]MCB9445733.1 rRNA adenine methyltransferase [Ardenticatenaceae bacterium]
MIDWELTWSPYDEPTYAAVLSALRPTDVVLDIGAGDLRLARRMAAIVQRVIAWEIQPDVLKRGLEWSLPTNIAAILTDARHELVPPGVNVAVLLMRHCTTFRFYAEKLAAAGCRWLLTNARWGLGLEKVDLLAERVPYTAVSLGWFACCCGHTGFVPGPAEELTEEVEKLIHEVYDCPKCG